MKTVIIDDEPDAVDSLELIIEDFLPELAITNTFTDPLKALKKLPVIQPDLVFLDISMPGLNGFELLEKLGNFNFEVIFTTAYDQHAIKAFKFGASNYLLKPIDIDDLIAAVKRVLYKSKNEAGKQSVKIGSTENDSKIALSSIDGVYYLKPDEIIYLFADNTFTKIVLKNKKEIIVKKTLKDFENHLPKSFFRIHNSYVINVVYVKKLIKSDNWNVEMDNSEILPISRRKRNEFVGIMKYVTGNSIE